MGTIQGSYSVILVRTSELWWGSGSGIHELSSRGFGIQVLGTQENRL